MRSGGNIDFVIDMASSPNDATVNDNNVREGKNSFYKVWSSLVGCDGSNRGDETVSFENRLHNCAEVRLENGEALVMHARVGWDEKVEKVVGAEKPKKKGFKKPPKPPRPPRPVSPDLADQKLIREISELAMLKRARAERIKALKKIKNGKAASSSAGNTFALVITLIFCIVIFWQGVFPRGSSTSAFLVSPQSSMGTSARSSSSFISIQFYSNSSANAGSS